MRKTIIALEIEYDETEYDPPMYWDWVSLLDCAAEVVYARGMSLPPK